MKQIVKDIAQRLHRDTVNLSGEEIEERRLGIMQLYIQQAYDEGCNAEQKEKEPDRCPQCFSVFDPHLGCTKRSCDGYREDLRVNQGR